MTATAATSRSSTKREDGWASRSYRWTLDELAFVDGWVYDRPHADEHSSGFWLRRA
ncbi:hypothetical protein [Nonomuraea turkmeniaca]|uniref:hypothetical protein n=1 Tax=Nonomuraea turkmeniaca TaxID=103838 RepID=UPI001476FA25|nr:hypothetical protein [Nonomuraea turkmeniaca]